MNNANGASITWSRNFILCSPLSYLGGGPFSCAGGLVQLRSLAATRLYRRGIRVGVGLTDGVGFGF